MQTCTYKPQNRQVGSAFALMYSLRLRSCRLMGAFIISPLPPFLIQTSCAARSLRSAGVTPLLRYYGPSRHRLAFSRFPGCAGYTAYLAPPISRWDEDGFSSCSACPCHRAAPNHPAGVTCRVSQSAPCHAAFARTKGLGLRIHFCRGHLWVHFRYGPVTRSPSQGWLCQLTSPASFPPRVRLKLQDSDYCLGGFTSH